MAGDIYRTTFERALEELRFDDAEQALADCDPDEAVALQSELATEREMAEQRALDLYQRLKDCADTGDHATILRLQQEPETSRLMDLLSDTPRDRAELFFRTAARWEDSQRHTARRRLTDARRALDGLDLQLARGLLARVDNRFLTEDETAQKDALLLEVSARSMELESLEQEGHRLIDEATPKRRRWWRRD